MPEPMTDRERAAYIRDYGKGPRPWPLMNMLFVDAAGVEWLLCDDGYWSRVDRLERLVPATSRCRTCGCPLHAEWLPEECRWCRTVLPRYE